MSPDTLSFTDPTFWRLPLEARMAAFAELREQGPFLKATVQDIVGDASLDFYATTRFAEVLEISKRPQDFCSGKGSVSVFDMPEDTMEFFGSFIAMDNPRHARQRGIVGRSFAPRELQAVLESVETVCTEVIDGICEKGEVDLVEAISRPFPLLIICDMMGIPRSEFDTVLDATNVILGAGDPEMLHGKDIGEALIGAGVQLVTLMNELAEDRRANPRNDLTSALVHNTVGEDMLAPHEIAPFFILLAVAGNDTTRTAISLGMHLLAQNPDQRAIWQSNVDGVTATAVEEIIRAAFVEGDKVIMFYGAANRDPRAFDNPERFDVLRDPNPHVGFGGPGPHFCLGAHLARRELAVLFRQLFARLPDIEVVGDPVPLEALGIPLVGGIKRLPVRFTPTAPSGS
jgi:cytochrome P450